MPDIKKVKFKSTAVFSDSVLSRHFSFGEYELDEANAMRLEKDGKGSVIGKSKKDNSSDDNSNSENTEDNNSTDENKDKNPPAGGTELGDKFPSKDVLVAAGFDTIEKVKELDQDKLSALKLSKADITKVGLAIAELNSVKK